VLDRERLDLFLRLVDELVATRLIRTGALSDALHFSATAGQPAIFSVSVPDEDDFRSFLVCFRHLVANREPATLDQVANILLHKLEPEEPLGQFVSEARDVWRGASKQGPIQVIIDDAEYGPEEVLDLYLNGQYFHSDLTKAGQLDSVGAIGEKLTRQQLNGMLVAGVNYANKLRRALLSGRSEGLLDC